MPKSTCRVCKALIPIGKSHCTTHNRAFRGLGSRWDAISREAIRLAPFCVKCNSRADLTTDHIIPRSRGGTDGADNLQVLCRSCNSGKGNGVYGG